MWKKVLKRKLDNDDAKKKWGKKCKNVNKNFESKFLVTHQFDEDIEENDNLKYQGEIITTASSKDATKFTNKTLISKKWAEKETQTSQELYENFGNKITEEKTIHIAEGTENECTIMDAKNVFYTSNDEAYDIVNEKEDLQNKEKSTSINNIDDEFYNTSICAYDSTKIISDSEIWGNDDLVSEERITTNKEVSHTFKNETNEDIGSFPEIEEQSLYSKMQENFTFCVKKPILNKQSSFQISFAGNFALYYNSKCHNKFKPYDKTSESWIMVNSKEKSAQNLKEIKFDSTPNSLNLKENTNPRSCSIISGFKTLYEGKHNIPKPSVEFLDVKGGKSLSQDLSTVSNEEINQDKYIWESTTENFEDLCGKMDTLYLSDQRKVRVTDCYSPNGKTHEKSDIHRIPECPNSGSWNSDNVILFTPSQEEEDILKCVSELFGYRDKCFKMSNFETWQEDFQNLSPFVENSEKNQSNSSILGNVPNYAAEKVSAFDDEEMIAKSSISKKCMFAGILLKSKRKFPSDQINNKGDVSPKLLSKRRKLKMNL